MKDTEKEISVFENLTYEKTEQEVEAEKKYNHCLENNHTLDKHKTPNGFSLLVCEQCKVKYTLRLKTGERRVGSVSPFIK